MIADFFPIFLIRAVLHLRLRHEMKMKMNIFSEHMGGNDDFTIELIGRITNKP